MDEHPTPARTDPPALPDELQNQDLNAFFTLSDDMMGLVTMAGRFIRINPAFERLCGLPLEYPTTRDFVSFVHRDDRKATWQAMARLKAGRRMVDHVNRCLCLDGSYHWLEWRLLRYQGGFVYVLARDITRRKQTEEALERALNELASQQQRTEHLQECNTQLRALANAHVSARELERVHIIGVVHDHLQQLIAAALLNLRMLKTKGPHAAQVEELEHIEEMLKDCIATTHMLTAELSPAVLP